MFPGQSRSGRIFCESYWRRRSSMKTVLSCNVFAILWITIFMVRGQNNSSLFFALLQYSIIFITFFACFHID
ncbi:hypothetical protein BJV82DRAFT_632008 [Fennellomyces sp. T-0311]|nr:hypothetical protein BJV82DRAFT_632008 [Fennellomyces sp. T-0311]